MRTGLMRPVSVALIMVGLIRGAWAAENGTTNYPAGSPGVFISAFPPIPGLFAISQTNYTSSNGLYDGQGSKLPINFKLSAVSETMRFLASYPGDFFGAHIYSQLVVPYVHLESSNPGGSFQANGFANPTFSPIILNWVSPMQSFTLGLDIMPNIGTYSARQPLNVGTNYTTISPVLAYRYADPKGLEVAVSPRLLLNNTNTDSVNAFTQLTQQYRSGDALVVDFAAGYNIGAWKFGVVGGYTHQYQDDKVNGMKAFNFAGVQDGNRLRSINAGPSLTYNAGPYQININYQHTFYVENGSRGDTVWANLAFPIWVPAPPPGAGPVKH
ncbi:transporter [Bradyrhizobium sp. SZCCHNR2017]|uniref:SphA family protein n=1 Tax=unclassified Bradyrhizobium TaxID=2631580 RepID=UPI00396727DC